MSASNVTENDVLKMICQGTDPAWRAGATGYWALFTADPGETGSLAAECNYTSYARVAQTKASAWTDGGSTFSNAALVQWPQCTGGSNDATHFAWGVFGERCDDVHVVRGLVRDLVDFQRHPASSGD